MKISVSKKREALRDARLSVSRTNLGDVCFSIIFDDESAHEGQPRFRVSVEHAVYIWRCFIGEVDECMVSFSKSPDCSYTEKMEVEYDSESETWAIRTDTMSFVLTANQALSLSWAIKKCVTEALMR